MKRNKITAKFRYFYLLNEDKKFSDHLSYVNRKLFKATLRQRNLSRDPIGFFPSNLWDKPSQLWKTSWKYWYNPIFPSKAGLFLLEVCNIISLFRQFRQSFFIFLLLFKKVSIFFCIPFFSFFMKYPTSFPFLNFSQKFAKVLGLFFYFFWKKRCYNQSKELVDFSKLIGPKLLSQLNNECCFSQNQKISNFYFENPHYKLRNERIVPKKYCISAKHAILLFYLAIFSRWFKKNYELISFKS